MKLEEFTDYVIYADGSIFSRLRRIFLHGYVDGKGYRKIYLWKDKKPYRFSVHRLVALKYLPNHNNYPCINHKDGNKLNNNASNLEWCTYSENTLHGIRTGLMGKHLKNFRPYMRKPVTNGEKIFDSLSNASKQTGILIGSIANCLTGRSKKAGGYIWHYV